MGDLVVQSLAAAHLEYFRAPLHDWEQGRREPSGAAKTLLYIAARHPDIVQEIVEQRT